ncbi:MAG: threonine ammonia-lyase [Actinomycetota bacterium]|nr:threonine ammonia-lyase [Actinomycetota bacterium]
MKTTGPDLRGGLVDLAAIEEARGRLEGVAVTTPLDRSRALSEHVGGPVFIKCENLQRTGSFKIRGAYNRIVRLDEAHKTCGVVAASAGNHAQGVALAASLAGAPARVFMPAAASLPKVEATRRYGAEVVLTGKDFGEAFEAAVAFAEEHGSTFVHPFDHPDVIAGQGTVGYEIVEQLADVNTVVVPVGGGGLISGVSAAVKALKPSTRVVGVQAKGAASFKPSLERGSPVTLDRLSTIADGIAANSPGELTLAHVRENVDEIVEVSDEAIAEALVLTLERMKLVLEPAGAAGVAAVVENVAELKPPVVVLLSGGNIDPLLLLRVIRFGLSASGRYFAFHTRIADRPGELHRLLGLMAEMGANVVGVSHHREGVEVDLGQVEVTLQVETKGPNHIGEIRSRLAASGYPIDPR